MGTLAPTQKVVPDPVVQAAVPKVVPKQVSQPQPYVSVAPAPAHLTPPPQQRVPSGPVSAQKSAPIVRPSAPATAQPRPHRSSAPGTVQQRPSTQRPVAPSGSRPPAAARSARGSSDRSLEVPKRRWGLIIVVLLLDLGLAGAGVYLLMEGLASGDVVPTKTGAGSAPAPAPVATAKPAAPPPTAQPKPDAPKPEAPKPDPTAGSSSIAAIAAIAAGSGSGSGSGVEPSKPEAPPKPTKQPPKKPKLDTKQPVDPYQEPPPSGPVLGPAPDREKPE